LHNLSAKIKHLEKFYLGMVEGTHISEY